MTCLLVLLLACPAAADDDGWLTRSGYYRVNFESALDPIVINAMHHWIFTVTTPDGAPVTGAVITATGGMPEHNHGLPTAPQMTAELGKGRYRVDGFRFHMTGEWELLVNIDVDGRRDSVVIPTDLMSRTRSRRAGIVFAVLLLGVIAWWQFGPRSPAPWTDADMAVLRSLSLDSLPDLPPDPSNAVADNDVAARLGQQLFFDPRLSANGSISCATCHQPGRRFTDGLPKGRGIGLSARNTRSIVGTAYSPWQYWDGRRDSQWAQALSPLEDPAEHGSNRVALVRTIAAGR